ncbi:MAG: M12 family metallo-peptidase, partial [Saprospiraceae bacterium]|nr:M12 family metallo-peptidase [Saprospiraceae bacterium]
MRHTLLIIFSLGTTLVQSQHTWRSLSPVELQRAGISDGIPIPREYSLWQLDEVVLAEFLKSGEIHLPMPDASIKIYTSVELSNMHPKLAEKYPSIKTYEVTDQQEERFRGRVDFSRHGIFAVLETAHGEVYIDAVGPRSSSMHMVYFTRDYKVDPSLRESYVRHEHGFDHLPSDFLTLEPSNSPFQRTANELVNLQVYELALSCTGEYAQKHGGTIEGALSAMNTALTRINFLLEAEVAVRLLLIEDNDSLIFLDGSNDPFTNGDAGQMALENNNFLTMQLPGTGYDVGHVFGTNCGAVVGTSGGIGTVCSGTKGFGSSCEIATNDRFYIGIVCHELGHQFGARHTWNNCPPVSQDQYSSSTAYEPGSGSTIMSYAGTCGDQNIQFDSDPYYHINSIVDIMSFISNGGGQGCADPEVTANHKPGLSVPYVDGFSIPISTPFKLVAEGEDSDGDPITFSWEQYDPGVGAGANTPIGEPQGSAPLFRSAPPSSTPVRIFPSMQKVLNNSFDDTEVLPDYGRNLTFRVTARDHRSAGGGVSWTQVAFKSSTAAGPFTVSSFNVPDTIETGEFVEIRWDVANTDQTPVNCKRIHILLSTDGGSSFSDTLISNSANDGSEMVLIPNLITNRARILVEAADNIFFDVNDQNITIRDAQIAGFGVDLLPHSQRVCLPDQIELELQSFPLGGFTD